MPRKLPDDPTKRRLQIMKRLYQHLEHWHSLIEAGEMSHIVTIPDTGEEIFLLDMLVGIDALPPRQREAFELICLQGWTETDATKKMLPDSKWSTPVQQYSDTALARMVASYDEKQAGTFVYARYEVKTKRPNKIVTKGRLPTLEEVKSALGEEGEDAPSPSQEAS